IDYVSTTGILNFAAGQTSATFTVTILNDAVPEPAETVGLFLSDPTGGASLGVPATATLTILDDDEAQPGALQFGSQNFSVSESEPEAIITVIRTGGSNGVVTADFATANGTAVAGQDFVATNGTLVFGDTELLKTIAVRIQADAIAEGSETFTLTLSHPTVNAVLNDPFSTTVTIVDGEHTVDACEEASLRAAVNLGGRVSLTCDGTIVLTSPLTIAKGVSLDASGHSVALSGSNVVRLFN